MEAYQQVLDYDYINCELAAYRLGSALALFLISSKD